LLKAALLYADRVKLCSPASYLLLALTPTGNLSEDEQLDLAISLMESSGEQGAKTAANMTRILEQYRALGRKKIRSRQEIIMYKKLERAIERDIKPSLRTRVEQLLEEAQGSGLVSALNAGIVELHPFDVIQDRVVEEFLDSITAALSEGKTYPLFDDSTGQLVKSAINEGLITPLSSSISRAKQVGLTADLFNRLPLFDNATVKEILVIRKELDAPLVRFRAAVVGFSRDILSASWDDEFPYEADQVFLERVEPAILELEEVIKSNKVISELVDSLTKKPLLLAAPSALGVFLSSIGNLPDITRTALSLTAGATVIALDVVKAYREKREETERNSLYFYYKVGKVLSS
jgi:hypothetical protein